MGKFLQLTFILLEIIIIAYIVSNFIYNAFPIKSAVFWISIIGEGVLAYLTYFFWKRSMRGREYSSDRVKAILIFAAGIILPAVTYYSGLELLGYTGYAEIFYICFTLALFLYLSFRMRKLDLFQRHTN